MRSRELDHQRRGRGGPLACVVRVFELTRNEIVSLCVAQNRIHFSHVLPHIVGTLSTSQFVPSLRARSTLPSTLGSTEEANKHVTVAPLQNLPGGCTYSQHRFRIMLILNDIVVPNTTLHIANRERTISRQCHGSLTTAESEATNIFTCPRRAYQQQTLCFR